MTTNCPKHPPWLLRLGIIGSIIAALCCATPILGIVLTALGLGWFIGLKGCH